MRSRGVAGSRRTRSEIRPVYEDFQPSSEWKHEEDASVLLYHLPGFVKDQIRIIAESRGILRVRGERQVANNKWSRFQEEVRVPEDCNMSAIRAKFEGGILRITMPKKISSAAAKPPIEQQSSQTHEPHTSSVPRPGDLQPPPQDQFQQGESSSKQPPTLPTTPQAPTTIMGTRDESNKPHPQKLHENEIIKDDANKDQQFLDSSKSKAQEESLMKGNESENKHQEIGPRVHKKDNEVYADALDQHNDDVNMSNRLFANSLLKRLDDDRQSLVNIGAAVLVIVALGAHIAYSFAPST